MKDSNGYNPLFISMAIGALIGGLISGGINLYSQLTSGESFSWGDFVVALLSGATSGVLAGSGIGLWGQIAGNAAISAGSYVATSNGDMNGWDFGVAVGIGAATGWFGGPGAYKDIGPAILQADQTIFDYGFNNIKYSARQVTINNLINMSERKIIENSVKTFISGSATTYFSKNLSYNEIWGFRSSTKLVGSGRSYLSMSY